MTAVIAPYGSALVAFSGVVDSSLALAIALRALPEEQVLTVTSNTETYLPSELKPAREFAASIDVEQIVIQTRKLDNPDYASNLDNPDNCCYFCKSTLYSYPEEMAKERGYGCIMDGANPDDE